VSLWVLVEKREKDIHPVSLELLTKTRELCAALRERLVAVLLGETDNEKKTVLARYGAEEILEVQNERGNLLSPELQAETFCMAANEERPSIIVAGAIQTRPAFGGNILAVIECPTSSPQMATVRPHVFRMEKARRVKTPAIRAKCYSPAVKRVTEVLERVVEDEKTDITQADIIVSGGRGLGKPEGFTIIDTFARRLGGMIGASRGVVDLGWISAAHQVGQTGHTVNPKLYIACGISGAVQHVAGMKGAETIIAINKDPEAPIFEIADYGIIGDLYDIVPAILKELDSDGSAAHWDI